MQLEDATLQRTNSTSSQVDQSPNGRIEERADLSGQRRPNHRYTVRFLSTTGTRADLDAHLQ